MFRRAVLCALALSASAGCASIDGKSAEPDDSVGPSTAGNGGGDDDAGGGPGAANGAVNGAANNGGSAADDAGATAGDGGASTAADGGTDAGPPPTPPNGTCAAPYTLSFTNKKASATQNTTGGSETLNPKCGPGALFTALPGPDHVYALEMPFKGQVIVQGNAAGAFQPSVYMLSSCGNSASEKACDFGGSFTYDVSGPQSLFIYVDSGGSRDAVFMTEGPTAGAYQLSVTLREELGEGKACSAASDGDYCAAPLVCRNESGSSVCRAISCGDGFVEGNEECDDNAVAGDGCSMCKFEARESCANAPALVFRDEAGKRVARAAGTTLGAVDDLDPDCAAGASLDHVYSFTLTATSSVDITLDPGAGYDATLAVVDGACTSVATIPSAQCVEVAADGAVETFSDTSMAAGTYFVVVDGYTNSDRGDYELTVSVSP